MILFLMFFFFLNLLLSFAKIIFFLHGVIALDMCGIYGELRWVLTCFPHFWDGLSGIDIRRFLGTSVHPSFPLLSVFPGCRTSKLRL